MRPASNTHCAKLLVILSDGDWHSTSAILRRTPMIVHSRIAELREKGWKIEHRTVTGRKGAHGHAYRWTDGWETRKPWNPAPFAREPITDPVEWETVAPRNEAERFRVYRLDDGEPELLATCATEAAVGVTICMLGREGEFRGQCIGLLDTHGTDEKPGAWIVNPWDQR